VSRRRRDAAEDIPFAALVQRTVRRVPAGRVISYGGVAALLGAPRAARGVGQVLGGLPEDSDVPWWRVINAAGRISLHGYPGMLQRMMLEAEGVRPGRAGRIDWARYGWRPDGEGPPPRRNG
jgi:methylated-DNA-protein-cysteine methyltransferase-like protein